jgi:hypothetical protein
MRRPTSHLARCLATILLALGPAAASRAAATAGTLAAPVGAGPAGLVMAGTLAVLAGARPPGVGCPAGGVEVDLAGSGDTAVVSGHSTAACGAASGSRPAGGPRPYWTYEIACSPDKVRAAEGLCSTTPCVGGLYFALRTLHRPDGRTEAAGYSCVSLERALAGPTLTAADVFAAVRRVKLPTGAVRVTPSGRGLANLPSRLWLVGDSRPPVDLPLPGSTVHAEFQPVQYRWIVAPGDTGAVGSGGRLVSQRDGVGWTIPARPEGSGRDGEVAMVFPGTGRFVVSVVTTWSASAFLDGRFVGQVDGLTSTARIAYPVAELRAELSD